MSGGHGVDAAVDLDQRRQTELVAHPAQFGDLLDRTLDERLPAEAGIHAHDEHQVDERKNFHERVDGRTGIDRHPGSRTPFANRAERAVQVR